jgi:hypothetical protein
MLMIAVAAIVAVAVSSRVTSPDSVLDTVTQTSPTRAPLGVNEVAEMNFLASKPTPELNPHQLVALTWLAKDPQILNYSVYRLQQRSGLLPSSDKGQQEATRLRVLRLLSRSM